MILSHIVALAAAALVQGAAPIALTGLDPVELCQGREVAGKPELVAGNARHRFQFSSEANRVRYMSDPERWGLQIGGACAKMGPLSGAGALERWKVYQGRIWVFASEGCRNSFEKNPAAYLDQPDHPFSATAEELAEGKKRLDAMAVAHGPGLDKAKFIRWETKTAYQAASGPDDWIVVRGAEFPSTFAEASKWISGTNSTTVQGEVGAYIDSQGKDDELFPMEVDHFRRGILREPVVLLRLRNEPGFIAKPEGSGARVYFKGLNILLLPGEAGKVVEARFWGRFAGPNTDVIRTYEDFREVNGVAVPFKVVSRAAAGGDPQPSVRSNVYVE